MINMCVMYPNTPGSKFDWDYYMGPHAGMVMDRIGDKVVDAKISKGLAGGAPDQPATYVAVANLYFDGMDQLQAALGQHGAEIMGDIPNFTDVQPVVQISEVV